MIEHDPLISEYQHENFRPRADEALFALRRVSSLVKPIMRQRGWKVGILCEFYPPDVNLLGLNWNYGQKICLRLRYPGDETQFLPLDRVVDTMLHELCHIVYGPHDANFHALWNALRDDHVALTMKGYTGEGFLSPGRRLGSKVPPYATLGPALTARNASLVAAERRRVVNGGSGQRLGGRPIPRTENIRNVIADAAQRRLEITRGCRIGRKEQQKAVEEADRNGAKTKAEEEGEDQIRELDEWISLLEEEEEKKEEKYEPWTCEICTLINPPSYLCCGACATERPSLLPFVPASASGGNSSIPPRQSNNNRNIVTKSSLVKNSASRQVSKIERPTRNAIQSLLSLDKAESSKRCSRENGGSNVIIGGWVCHNCGTWMDKEWWTCTRCGVLKLSS